MTEELTNEVAKEIIEAIRLQYGYDFSNYAPASFKRRLARFADQAMVSYYELKYHVINNEAFFSWLLQSLTVNVTEMFRDPVFYKKLKEEVFPVLATYPTVKIWHAGCSSGEEAYSMAIMLQEADLLHRTKIYATDMNMSNIEKANSGIISLSVMKDYTYNYQKAGGTGDFSNYYTAMYDHALINKNLRKNILFSQHNLVTDQVFNEFQLICCRNVMIYFNRELQDQVINLFYNSLSPLGYLALGIKESLIFSARKDNFDIVDTTNKIYRRKLK